MKDNMIDNALANHDQAQAFLVQMTDVLDGNGSVIDHPSPDIVVTPDSASAVDIPDITSFSAIPFSSTNVTVSAMNDDLFFEVYSSSIPKFISNSIFAFSSFSSSLLSLTNSLPIVLLASSFPFNSVLDSGCMHHIICNHALFWTYDTTSATPIKMANCGFLQTLACGSVCFHVSSGSHTVTFILNDCLHTLDALINLLSVGALTEKGAIFTLTKGRTTIAFSPDYPVLLSFSFDATIINHLSFLDCNFVLPLSPLAPSLPDPPSPLLDLSNTALATIFPQVSLTPELWHCCFGHLGIEATQAVLTKDYITGIEHTGSFAHTHCVPCLIGRTPQCPFLNQGH